jgi:hypothetical protein
VSHLEAGVVVVVAVVDRAHHGRRQALELLVCQSDLRKGGRSSRALTLPTAAAAAVIVVVAAVIVLPWWCGGPRDDERWWSSWWWSLWCGGVAGQSGFTEVSWSRSAHPKHLLGFTFFFRDAAWPAFRLSVAWKEFASCESTAACPNTKKFSRS